MEFLSNIFASIASVMSGASDKRTYILVFEDIECPKELL